MGQIRAVDADLGANAQLTYTVLSEWANDVFSLNPQTGVFTLTAKLDYEEVSGAGLRPWKRWRGSRGEDDGDGEGDGNGSGGETLSVSCSCDTDHVHCQHLQHRERVICIKM